MAVAGGQWGAVTIFVAGRITEPMLDSAGAEVPGYRRDVLVNRDRETGRTGVGCWVLWFLWLLLRLFLMVSDSFGFYRGKRACPLPKGVTLAM